MSERMNNIQTIETIEYLIEEYSVIQDKMIVDSADYKEYSKIIKALKESRLALYILMDSVKKPLTAFKGDRENDK